MQSRRGKPILAVVSPFLDKRHGTERCIIEQIEHLAPYYEVHIYSSRVEDLCAPQIVWHRVPIPRGPEAFRFLWWFVANAFLRWRDRVRGFRPDLIYSPGPNALRADIVSVHAIFARMRRASKSPQSSGRAADWLRRMHRSLYYRIAERAERAVYQRKGVRLIAVSNKTAMDLTQFFGRAARSTVIYHGVDPKTFSPLKRQSLRRAARAELGIEPSAIAILLIGNDWRTKGAVTLIESVRMLTDPRVRIFLVGSESAKSLASVSGSILRDDPVTLLHERPDVEFYCAAADIYSSPSLEDSFALPVLEAMACGLPVITSRAAGVSEIIQHGKDGLVLDDPADARTLATYLHKLIEDADWREELGRNAAQTASNYAWERNARHLRALIEEVLSSRQVS